VSAVKRFTLALPPDQSLASWAPTDHVKVLVPGVPPRKPRSYSPTSPRSRVGSVDLTVKIYAGGPASAYFDALTVGDVVRTAGPVPLPVVRPRRRGYGPAAAAPPGGGGGGGGGGGDGRLLVVVALGIGITGALPVVVDELRRGARVALVHAVRFGVEAAAVDGVEAAAAAAGGRLTVHRLASGEAVDGWAAGRVDAEYLRRLVAGVAGGATDGAAPRVRWVVVGSKPQMRSVWGVLGKLGYSRWSHALYLKTLVPRGGREGQGA